jgi:hypothetical protein
MKRHGCGAKHALTSKLHTTNVTLAHHPKQLVELYHILTFFHYLATDERSIHASWCCTVIRRSDNSDGCSDS